MSTIRTGVLTHAAVLWVLPFATIYAEPTEGLRATLEETLRVVENVIEHPGTELPWQSSNHPLVALRNGMPSDAVDGQTTTQTESFEVMGVSIDGRQFSGLVLIRSKNMKIAIVCRSAIVELADDTVEVSSPVCLMDHRNYLIYGRTKGESKIHLAAGGVYKCHGFSSGP